MRAGYVVAGPIPGASKDRARVHAQRGLQPYPPTHGVGSRGLYPAGEAGCPEFSRTCSFFGRRGKHMRQVLIDHARTRNAAKRGGGESKVPLTDGLMIAQPTIVEIDDAMSRLSQRDPLKGKLVEFRFFGGLTAEESAEVLNIPVATVRQHLRVAQAWLQRELARDSKTSSTKNRAGPARLPTR